MPFAPGRGLGCALDAGPSRTLCDCLLSLPASGESVTSPCTVQGVGGGFPLNKQVPHRCPPGG